MHVSLFGTVLSISDNIMHYQWLIIVFLKNTSRDQLLQKAYRDRIRAGDEHAIPFEKHPPPLPPGKKN